MQKSSMRLLTRNVSSTIPRTSVTSPVIDKRAAEDGVDAAVVHDDVANGNPFRVTRMKTISAIMKTSNCSTMMTSPPVWIWMMILTVMMTKSQAHVGEDAVGEGAAADAVAQQAIASRSKAVTTTKHHKRQPSTMITKTTKKWKRFDVADADEADVPDVVADRSPMPTAANSPQTWMPTWTTKISVANPPADDDATRNPAAMTIPIVDAKGSRLGTKS